MSGGSSKTLALQRAKSRAAMKSMAKGMGMAMRGGTTSMRSQIVPSSLDVQMRAGLGN